MPFLIIAGQTIPISEGNAAKRIERDGANERAFNGTLRFTGKVEKRQWAVVTGMMLNAAAATLETATALGAQVVCSGDLLGSTVTCAVEVGDNTVVNVTSDDGLGFMRTVALLLREV